LSNKCLKSNVVCDTQFWSTRKSKLKLIEDEISQGYINLMPQSLINGCGQISMGKTKTQLG